MKRGYKPSIRDHLPISGNYKPVVEQHPSDRWERTLTNIQATRQTYGLVLRTKQGYHLPEEITVMIGKEVCTIHTRCLENPEDIAFDPSTGMVSFPSLNGCLLRTRRLSRSSLTQNPLCS